MAIPLEELRRIIRAELIDKIQSEIKQRYKSGEASMAWIAELFIQELLNVVFKGDYQFINLNHKHPNYPAVDLGDTNKGVAWQITVTNSEAGIKKKISDTLKSFYENCEREKFAELKIYKELHLFVATGLPDKLDSKFIPKSVQTKHGEVVVESSFFNETHIWDFNRLINEKLRGTSTSLLEDVERVVKRIAHRPVQPQYVFDREIIERTVSIGDRYREPITKDIFPDGKRHIALLANAAEGKTLYMDYLAKKFSLKGDVFCIRARLIKYATSILNLIESECKNWQNCYYGQKLIVLLDGLDEVNSIQLSRVFKEIEEFVKLFPHVHVITSCRTNVYPLGTNGDEDENFSASPCFLELIKEKERQDYIIKKLGHRADAFISAINTSAFDKLIETPFFLVELIDLYQENGTLPSNKAALMAELVERRFKYELKKIDINQAITSNRIKIDTCLKQLALVMLISGTNRISEIQMQQIISDAALRKLIQRVMLEPIDSNKGDWRFYHNNFLEYYAAFSLIESDWSQIHETIRIPGTENLRPRWLNTVSFFISIAQDEADEDEYNKLINWLAEFNKNAIVKFEVETLSSAQRNDILFSLLDEHRRDNLRIWRDGYTVEDLAKFIEIDNNQEAVNCLITILKEENLPENFIIDILDLLNQLKETADYKVELVEVYLGIYRQNYTNNIGYRILAGLHQWQMYDTVILKEITSDHYDLTKVESLFAYLDYIGDSDYHDITMDFMERSVIALLDEDYGTSFYSYPKALGLIKTREQMLAFLDVLMDVGKEERYSEVWSDNNVWNIIISKIDDLARILLLQEDYPKFLQCIDYIGGKIAIFGRVYEPLSKINLFTHHLDIDSVFIDYLQQGDKMKHYDDRHFIIPALLYTEDKLDVLFKLYKENKISHRCAINFSNTIYRLDKEKGIRLNDALKAYSDDFKQDENPWDKQRQLKEELFLKSLLDKSLFKSHLIKIFELLEDTIHWEHLVSKMFYEDGPLGPEIDIALDLLQELVPKDGSLTKSEIWKWFENDDKWEWFVVVQYTRLSYNSIIPSDNLQWIRNWCTSVEQKSLIDWSKLDIINTYLCRNYITLLLASDSKPSDETCIKLVRYIGYYSSINHRRKNKELTLLSWLQSKIGDKVVQKEVIRLLEEGIKDSVSLQELLSYAESKKLKTLRNALVDYCINPAVEYYLRNRAFDIYVKFGGGYVPVFEQYPALIEKEHQVNWHMINLISKHNIDAITSWLDEKWELLQINVSRAAIQYLKKDPEKGMDIYLTALMDRQEPLSDIFYEHGNFIKSIEVNNCDSEQLKHFLLKILTIYAGKDFNYGERDETIMCSFNQLVELFKLNPENAFMDDISKHIDFLRDSEHNDTPFGNILYWHKDFERQCFEFIDQGTSFKKALKEVKGLVPELFV
ncbi:SMEK domain-containing protein [Carboxylicivirga sp. A043]|uniref:SMEK domain-containing protein n=1 Tax=Carboxylicivirga litoralis TaxID=2816963 RepID=UPI0021CB45A6|nr:SMEK domain-containing protein [Carboxylicivirga sp. A043]MCU4157881.1 SMEK domain-containing protein [Carboxylicivirga sp. A043]